MGRRANGAPFATFLWVELASVTVAVVLAAGAIEAIRSNGSRNAAVMQEIGGDPDRAIPVMIRNGCGGCHEIPGVPGARGTVGPSLRGVAGREYIGGTMVRTSPDAMMRWISNSRDINPNTAMPNMNLSPQDARDIAAYLYTRT